MYMVGCVCVCVRVFKKVQGGLVTFKHPASSASRQKTDQMNKDSCVCVSTADGEPQLHSSFLRQFDMKSTAARHH